MSNKKEKQSENGLVSYLKGVRSEVKKVVWPSGEELGKYTVLVIVISFVTALIIFLFDSAIARILNLIIG